MEGYVRGQRLRGSQSRTEAGRARPCCQPAGRVCPEWCEARDGGSGSPSRRGGWLRVVGSTSARTGAQVRGPFRHVPDVQREIVLSLRVLDSEREPLDRDRARVADLAADLAVEGVRSSTIASRDASAWPRRIGEVVLLEDTDHAGSAAVVARSRGIRCRGDIFLQGIEGPHGKHGRGLARSPRDRRVRPSRSSNQAGRPADVVGREALGNLEGDAVGRVKATRPCRRPSRSRRTASS